MKNSIKAFLASTALVAVSSTAAVAQTMPSCDALIQEMGTSPLAASLGAEYQTGIEEAQAALDASGEEACLLRLQEANTYAFETGGQYVIDEAIFAQMETMQAEVDVAQVDAGNTQAVVGTGVGGGEIVVEQPEPQVDVTVPEPTVTVDQAAPEVIVTQAEPQITVTVPRPTVTVNQADATITVTQAQPIVSVNIPEPVVTVEVPEPTVSVQIPAPEVGVQQGEPTVQVAIPEPTVTIRVPEPEVSVDQAQPQVAVATPEPIVRFVRPEPQIRVQRAEAAEVEIAQGEANVNITETETARLAVQQADAQVNVQQAAGQAEVRVEQAEAQVNVRQAEAAQVEVTQAEAQVNLTEAGEANVEVSQAEPVIAVEEAAAPVVEVEQADANVVVEQDTATAGTLQVADLTDENVRNAYVGAVQQTPFYDYDLTTLRSARVFDATGEDIGSVNDVIVDGSNVYALLEVGGFIGIGDSEVVVPLSDMQLNGDAVILPYTEEQVEALPDYDPNLFQTLEPRGTLGQSLAIQ